MTNDPSAMTNGLSATTIDPSAMTLDLSATTIDPSATIVDPSAKDQMIYKLAKSYWFL